MLFEARELEPFGQPVSSEELRRGEVYFGVLFLDDDGFVPILEPKVYIGRNLKPGDVDKVYFQDFASYRRGIRYESAKADDGAVFEVGVNNCIFEYARALDVLMYCELRRRKGAGGKNSNWGVPGVKTMEFLKRMYDRFNARDMEAALAAMHEDVVWANGMEGGYVHGREGVRQYWTRQWAQIDPRVEPVRFTEKGEGQVVVDVHQVVRDLNGNVIKDMMVGHLFQIKDNVITRFDIRET
jgi:ketosteroid isomerase-like protein